MGDDNQTTGGAAPADNPTTATPPTGAEQPSTADTPNSSGPASTTPDVPTNDASADFDLDLDQVVPKPMRVRFGGKIVEMAQPTTQQLFKLIRVGKELQSIDEKDPDLEKVDRLVDEAMEVVVEIAPAFAGQRFSFLQTAALINTVTRLTMPADNKELEARGVTPTETLKANETSSPTNLPTS